MNQKEIKELAEIIKKRYLEIAMSYPNYPQYNKDNHRLKLLVKLANDFSDYFEDCDKDAHEHPDGSGYDDGDLEFNPKQFKEWCGRIE